MVKPQLSTNFLLLSWTCSDTSIGYNPVSVLNTVDAGSYSNIRADTAEGLTRVFILHPVSTVLLAIAFLLSEDASFITAAALPVDGGLTSW